MRLLVLALLLLAGCSSVSQLGTIGPRDLQVYSIRSNGFLTASQMLVVLGSNGEVAAAAGGTVPGAGPLIGHVAVGAMTAGALAYAGVSLADSIRDIGVTAKGGVTLTADPNQIQQGAGLLGGL